MLNDNMRQNDHKDAIDEVNNDHKHEETTSERQKLHKEEQINIEIQNDHYTTSAGFR